MRAVLLEHYPGRSGGCNRGGGWETDQHMIAIAQERGRRSPNQNGGCEDGNKGK